LRRLRRMGITRNDRLGAVRLIIRVAVDKATGYAA
jgi:hypothetical protein